ncbi:unnamed protein product, partial [Closterium sp. NIES-65]
GQRASLAHPHLVALPPSNSFLFAFLPFPLPSSKVWEREVEHVSGGELQRFAVGVVGGAAGRQTSTCGASVRRRAADGFAIGVVAGQLGDIYMFDEPSSYLDVRQRLKAARVMPLAAAPPTGMVSGPNRYVIVVEHDLSVLDYLSDFICCLYGKPGAYGVVTLPFSVREGINIFLAGFVPTENLRFRDESLTFRVSLPFLKALLSSPPLPLLRPCLFSFPPPIRGRKTLVDNPEEGGQDVQSVRYRYLGMIKKHGGFNLLLPLPHSILSPPFIPSQVAETPVAETPVDNPEEAKTYTRYKYPRMVKKQGGFKLTVEPGDFTDSQIVVMLGENGTGKTTFIRMLVGKLSLMGAHAGRHMPASLKADPDEETGKEAEDLPEFNVSLQAAEDQPQAGLLKADPDEETGKEAEDLPEFNVSYKAAEDLPQVPHSVRALLHSKIRDSFHHPQFNTDVLRPMQIDPLLDQEVVNLSGGELQRVAITFVWERSCPMQIDPLLDQEVVKISGGELQRVAITLCLGKIDPLLDQEVVNLSGGELQRMAISLCLGKPADIYLIDEPSAYLDSEQRIVAAKPADIYLIDEPSAYLDSEQRIVAAKHDFIMATYLADRVIVYEGQPSVDCTACTPQVAQQRHEPLPACPRELCACRVHSWNPFLPPVFTSSRYRAPHNHRFLPPPTTTTLPPQQLDITFRRDPTNFRPRINKMDSVKDREQKNAGTYYYLDD